jgi:epsin
VLIADYRRRASPQAAAEFDEYEGADDFADTRRTGSSTSQRTARPPPPPKGTPRAPKVVEKPKEVNLFDFGDDEPAPAAPPAPVATKQEDLFGGDGTSEPPQHKANCADDFDDFQSAPAPAPAPASKPAPAAANNNLFDLLNQGASKPAGQAPAYSGPSPGLSMPSLAPTPVSRPSYTSPAPAPAPAAKPAPTKSTFDDLFNTSLTSMGGQANGGQKAGQKSMKDLEKEKSMNALWAPAGQSSQSGQVQNNKSSGGGFDDLLM